MKPSRPSLPLTLADASVTSLMCLSTDCVWMGRRGTEGSAAENTKFQLIILDI